MSIKFLNRKHTYKGLEMYPCGQLVNVPELQGTQRCRYCIHNADFFNESDYAKCIDSHKCGRESLLYALLKNSMLSVSRPQSAHFSPSQVIKSDTIDNMTRYIQLWSCDLEGYECCRLCQFYAARVAADQSIADCSNTHACGRNGSFWDLLQISNNELYDMPSFLNAPTSENQFYTLDGVLHDATFQSFVYTDNSYVQVQMSDGHSYYIVLMLKNYTTAWHMLKYFNQNPLSWVFSQTWNDVWFNPSDAIIISDIQSTLAHVLIDAGVDEKQFICTKNACANVTTSESNQRLFTQLNSDFGNETHATKHILMLSDAEQGDNYAIRIGLTNTYLTLPYAGASYSNARKTKFDSGLPSSVPYITVTGYITSLCILLRAKGLRPSLFYNI